MPTYFEENKKLLKQVIEDYEFDRSNSSFFSANTHAIFNNLESGITAHTLRPYQMEALFILDYLLKAHPNRPEKEDLMEEVDEETGEEAPFMTFEMATGSGKTMLMGASIYLLNQKYGIKNFLVITPASTDIYQKTIRNFQKNTFESVWANDTPFSFNLITGDNYKDSLDFDDTKDANIFVFNISKFGSNAINTDKMWESSIWRDDEGSGIGIKQFLKNQKLVIITDESHHHQSVTAKKIIKNFKPTAVLEYSATAIEAERGQDKKNQQIVYRYDIRRFLEDGHGKLIRAFALANNPTRSRDEINVSEKHKLITLCLIHLIKKKAMLTDVSTRSLKPLAFIKVKEDTVYTQKVFDYIRNDLPRDIANIKFILEKAKSADLTISNLITEYFKTECKSNISTLANQIESSVKNSIFYHGKSDKETERKWAEVRKNDVEIVVYMQRLDEGIDLPNIYTIAVVNDTVTNFKTSVKQIIGRGVRLNKNVRDFDGTDDPLKGQSEKLHIVCDQGAAFEEVIRSIQQEFGLSNKYLSYDRPKESVTNKAKSSLLAGKYLPHVKAEFKAKEGVRLIGLIEDVETIVNKYIESNCFTDPNDPSKKVLKFKPDSFFVEVDILADEEVFLEQIQKSGGTHKQLVITEKEVKSIYGIVQKTLYCLPDTENVRKSFQKYVDKLNSLGIMYYRIDDGDDTLAKNLLVNSFGFFYRNHIEKNYFEISFKQIDQAESWSLSERFKDAEIKIPSDQVKNRERIKQKGKRRELTHLINEGYHFYGYEKSIYDYDAFDSYPELQLAEYANGVLKTVPDSTKPFWVRNQRNVYFTYGSKKYYPDFIMFKDDFIYVIETKGEIYSDTRKNMLLKKLDEVPGDGKIKGYRGVLVFSKQLDDVGDYFDDFDRFVSSSDQYLKTLQTKSDLVESPPAEDMFVKFLPVYSPSKALKKFIKGKVNTKPDGWLPVTPKQEKYPEDVFATQVKGSALSPRLKNNQWVYIKQTRSSSDAENKITLVYSENIDEGYDKGFALREFSIKTRKSKTKLFEEKAFVLTALNSEYDPIEIQNVESEADAQIIGVEFIG